VEADLGIIETARKEFLPWANAVWTKRMELQQTVLKSNCYSTEIQTSSNSLRSGFSRSN
jgi:hypothetical protein